jgi:hypothetical protein
MQANKSVQYVIALIILLLLACFYLWMGSINSYAGNISDSHFYLFLADFFAGGGKLSSGLESFFAQTTQFPPLYSYALSLFGGGIDGIERAHQINNAYFAVGFMALFYWLHAQGIKPLVAITLILVLALNHQQLVYSTDILSESQYFLFSVLIVILLDDAKSRERLLLASALIGLSILSRTIGIAFLLPLLVQVIRCPTNWFRKGFMLILALLPALSWKFVQGQYLSHSVVPRVDYAGYLGFYFVDTIQTVTTEVTANLTALIQSWSNYLSGLPSILHLAIAFVLGISVLICWILRLRRFDPLALYLLGYFGIVLFWPFPDHMDRFMVPVFPFLLSMLVLDSKRWQFSDKKIAAQILLLGIMVITVLPASSAVVQRILTLPENDHIKYRMSPPWLTHESIEGANQYLKLMHIRDAAAESINQHIGESDCVYALLPSTVMLITRKPVSWLFGHGRPASEFNPATLNSCDYVFMVNGINVDSIPAGLFPYEIMREQLLPVFISETEHEGHTLVVAMLAKIIREDEYSEAGEEESQELIP